jgi:serine protease Do
MPVSGILAVDSSWDLALLETSGQNVPFLRLGDSDRVRPGEPVVVISSPLGLEGTVSTGHLSAVRRGILQATAPVSPGSSGGPLLNQAGEVIGIVTMTLIRGQNLNFAVPATRLKELLRQAPPERPPLLASAPSGLKRLLAVILRIPNTRQQSELLAAVAEALAPVDPTRARQVAEHARQIAESIADPEHRSSALTKVAGALAPVDLARARQVAEGIANPLIRSHALAEVAKALAPVDPTRARQVAEGIADPTARSWALRGVAAALAPVDLASARQIAESIADQQHRSWALAEVVEALAPVDPARARQVAEHARQVAESIADPEQRTFPIIWVVDAIILVDPSRAMDVLETELRRGSYVILGYMLSDPFLKKIMLKHWVQRLR